MRFGRGQSRCHAGRLDRGGGPILIAWLWCAVAVAGVPPLEELPPPSLPDAAVEEPVLLEPLGHTVGS
ncbi:MAG: hypothetical protein O3A37_15360, partial [Planctomycetota bacterium]|nr:hypothetical protein [Planctomycetota bacterium]